MPTLSPATPPAPLNTPAAATDWRGMAQLLALVIGTIICYLPSLNGGFLWDDRALTADDPLVKSGAGLWHIWFSTLPYDYFPLTYTSFWLEWPLWGADPLGYRAVNLVLHIGSALLFWRLLTRWRVPWAWGAAMLFALHPLNVASVAWIAERKNVLSMVFYLATLLCWTHAEEDGKPGRRRAWTLAALIAFALALASKSSVVMLPLVLLLIGWLHHGRVSAREAIRTLPFFALSSVAGLATLWFQHHRAMAPEALAAALPLPARAVLLGKAFWFYLGKACWPAPLSMLYPRWQLVPVHAVDFLPLAALVSLALGAGWLALRKGWRGPAAALGYFLLNLLPVAGLFHMSFYSFSYVSDHLAQLSLLGFCAFAAGSLNWLTRRSRAGAVALALVLGACACLTWTRAGEFGSGELLWHNTLALNPGSSTAQNNYGLVLDEARKRPAAEAAFHAALRLEPGMPAALTNLAAVLQEEKRWPEAAAAYQVALARHAEPADYNNYGVVLLYLGRTREAADAFHRALAGDPMLPSAHYNLYKIALAAGDTATANSEMAACRELDPSFRQN